MAVGRPTCKRAAPPAGRNSLKAAAGQQMTVGGQRHAPHPASVLSLGSYLRTLRHHPVESDKMECGGAGP